MIDSSADKGKLMRRKRMKSNLVSSGTMRRSFTPTSDRNGPRAPPAEPDGDNQPRQRERSEDRCDDADAERHCKAAHRTGADIEQNSGGDEGGDVGVENRCQSAAESCIKRVD